MKTLVFVIKDIGNETYEELLLQAKKQNAKISQILISISTGRAYCFKENTQNVNNIVA